MPVKDIPFIKGQREKEGTISSYQIGLKDMPEHNRQVRAEKRKDTVKELAQKRQKKENDERKRQEEDMASYLEQEERFVVHDNNKGDGDDVKDPDAEVQVEEELKEADEVQKRREYNTKEIRNVALASIRYGISSRATAAITTAAWVDGGLITKDDTKLVVDHNKVVRAQDRLWLT